MDRNTIVAFVLIGLVLMVWIWLTSPPQKLKNLLLTIQPLVQTQRYSKPVPVERDYHSFKDTLDRSLLLYYGRKKPSLLKQDCFRQSCDACAD